MFLFIKKNKLLYFMQQSHKETIQHSQLASSTVLIEISPTGMLRKADINTAINTLIACDFVSPKQIDFIQSITNGDVPDKTRGVKDIELKMHCIWQLMFYQDVSKGFIKRALLHHSYKSLVSILNNAKLYPTCLIKLASENFTLQEYSVKKIQDIFNAIDNKSDYITFVKNIDDTKPKNQKHSVHPFISWNSENHCQSLEDICRAQQDVFVKSLNIKSKRNNLEIRIKMVKTDLYLFEAISKDPRQEVTFYTTYILYHYYKVIYEVCKIEKDPTFNNCEVVNYFESKLDKKFDYKITIEKIVALVSKTKQQEGESILKTCILGLEAGVLAWLRQMSKYDSLAANEPFEIDGIELQNLIKIDDHQDIKNEESKGDGFLGKGKPKIDLHKNEESKGDRFLGKRKPKIDLQESRRVCGVKKILNKSNIKGLPRDITNTPRPDFKNNVENGNQGSFVNQGISNSILHANYDQHFNQSSQQVFPSVNIPSHQIAPQNVITINQQGYHQLPVYRLFSLQQVNATNANFNPHLPIALNQSNLTLNQSHFPENQSNSRHQNLIPVSIVSGNNLLSSQHNDSHKAVVAVRTDGQRKIINISGAHPQITFNFSGAHRQITFNL